MIPVRDQRFAHLKLDASDPNVMFAIKQARMHSRDGQKKFYEADEKTPSRHGQKVLQTRRAANKVARATRAAQNRQSALARRQRQKRRRQGR